MAEELKATKDSAENEGSFVCPLDHGMSEAEAAQLRAALEEAEEMKNEAMFAKQENEELRNEVEELQKEVERGGDVDEWKGKVDDADMEIANLKEQIDLKDEELVSSHSNITLISRMCCKINWPTRGRNSKNSSYTDPATQTATPYNSKSNNSKINSTNPGKT
jgi:chromosome segregation ATPase